MIGEGFRINHGSREHEGNLFASCNRKHSIQLLLFHHTIDYLGFNHYPIGH